MTPYRICCGQQHMGAQCPDRLVMCCHCFDRFPVEHLSVTDDGHPQDVCIRCHAFEQTRGDA